MPIDDNQGNSGRRKRTRHQIATDPATLDLRAKYDEVANEDEAHGPCLPAEIPLASIRVPLPLPAKKSQRLAVIALVLYPSRARMLTSDLHELSELRTSIDLKDRSNNLNYTELAAKISKMRFMPKMLSARQLIRARDLIEHAERNNRTVAIPIPAIKEFKFVVTDVEKCVADIEKKGRVISMSPDLNVAVLELMKKTPKMEEIVRSKKATVGSLADDREAWKVATDVIGVVRSQASQYIPKQYGEGIPKSLKREELREKIRAFLRGVAASSGMPANAETLAADFSMMLKSLRSYHGSAEDGVELVLTGAQLVIDLTGASSIWGLFARLNVVVMGKPLIDSTDFIVQMECLAEEAAKIKTLERTKKCMNWLNRLPKDQRLPGPGRFHSYVLANNVTCRLDGIATATLPDVIEQLAAVQQLLSTLRESKDGFELSGLTELLVQCVRAKVLGSTIESEVGVWIADLGEEKAQDLWLKCRDYEDSVALTNLVKTYLVVVYPNLRSLIEPEFE